MWKSRAGKTAPLPVLIYGEKHRGGAEEGGWPRYGEKRVGFMGPEGKKSESGEPRKTSQGFRRGVSGGVYDFW